MKTICVIGDIVGSRDIPLRGVFQQKLKRTLAALNRERRDLLSPYTLTLGDEFQVLYRRADRLFPDLFRLQGCIYPERARFSIGVGLLNTPLNRKAALGMDGPVFHGARDGIVEMKDAKGSTLFRVFGEEAGEGVAVNDVLDLISHSCRNWDRNRFDVQWMYMVGRRALDIARALKITDSAVYNNIQAGGLQTISALLKAISNSINQTVARS